MFDNPGATIKMVGKIVFWILAIGSIVSGAILMGEDVIVGLIVLVSGILISFLSVIVLIAFGELVENSTTTAYHSQEADFHK